MVRHYIIQQFYFDFIESVLQIDSNSLSSKLLHCYDTVYTGSLLVILYHCGNSVALPFITAFYDHHKPTHNGSPLVKASISAKFDRLLLFHEQTRVADAKAVIIAMFSIKPSPSTPTCKANASGKILTSDYFINYVSPFENKWYIHSLACIFRYGQEEREISPNFIHVLAFLLMKSTLILFNGIIQILCLGRQKSGSNIWKQFSTKFLVMMI